MDTLIQNSKKIEVYRVRAGTAESGPFKNLVVLRQGPDLNARQQAILKHLLLDSKTFASGRGEGGFDSGIVFRFSYGAEIADVAVCLISGEIDFNHHTKSKPTAASLEAGAATLTGEAFGELVRLARKIFPGDAELESFHPS